MNDKKGNEGGQACAACKHQRRKCHKNCLLAPYFPASQYEAFMNAQKLFGVSNIVKILNQIDPDQRREAIKSIMIESKARKDHPVEGIVGIIHKLQSEIQLCEGELVIVKQQLTYCQQREKLIYCRQKEQLQNQQQLLRFLASSSSSSSSQLLQQFHENHYQIPSLLDSANIESYPESNMKELNQHCTYSSTLPEYEDIKPLGFKTPIGRIGYNCHHKNAHINFKEAGESSIETVPKEK